MNITKWLVNFKTYWINHDIKQVLELFHNNVVYYETPFHKIKDKEELQAIWSGIMQQEKIELDLTQFNNEGNTFTIIWKLKYTQNGLQKDYAGTYLITLDDNNLCTYFYHCCEAK